MIIAQIIAVIAELVFRTARSLIDKILIHGMLQFDFYNPNYYIVKEDNGFFQQLRDDWFFWKEGSGQTGNPAASILSVFYRDQVTQNVIGAIAGTILALGIFFTIISMVTGPLTDKKSSSPLKIISKIIIWTVMVVLADQIMGVLLTMFTGILNKTSISTIVKAFEDIGVPENNAFQYPTDALLGDSIMLGLGTTMLMAIISYIERYVALGFTCFLAKISFAFGVTEETEDVPKQFFMSIGQQLIGIVLTIFLMAMGAMALSTDYRGYGLDVNDSHLAAMIFCSIFMSLSANSEKFLNVLGFKTMANGSATRAVIGGGAAVAMMAQRAYGMVASKGVSMAGAKISSSIQASRDAKAARGAFHLNNDGKLGSGTALSGKMQKTQDKFNKAKGISDKLAKNNASLESLGNKSDNLSKSNNYLREKNDSLRQKQNEIRSQMGEINGKKNPEKLASLKRQLGEYDNEIKKNNAQISANDKDIGRMANEMGRIKGENTGLRERLEDNLPTNREFAEYAGHKNPEKFSNDKMEIGYATKGDKQDPVALLSGTDEQGRPITHAIPLNQEKQLGEKTKITNADGVEIGTITGEKFEFDSNRGAAGKYEGAHIQGSFMTDERSFADKANSVNEAGSYSAAQGNSPNSNNTHDFADYNKPDYNSHNEGNYDATQNNYNNSQAQYETNYDPYSGTMNSQSRYVDNYDPYNGTMDGPYVETPDDWEMAALRGDDTPEALEALERMNAESMTDEEADAIQAETFQMLVDEGVFDDFDTPSQNEPKSYESVIDNFFDKFVDDSKK